MDQHILPRVERLKLDRTNYLEYQKVTNNFETLQRKVIAYDYHQCEVCFLCEFFNG